MSKQPLSKRNQAGRRHKATPRPLSVPESAIQKQANEMLQALRIENLRIPDGAWSALGKHPTIKMALAKGSHDNGLAGIADNTCFIPISDKYSLCLHLELKKQGGKLHGKQKNKARNLPYQISRSPDDTIRIINQFIEDAERLKNEPDRI